MKIWIALIENYSFTLEPTSLGIKGIAAAARKREQLGFDGILSPETAGHDPFVPLVIAAEHTTRVKLSTGIAVAFPRSPMVVAQVAWDLQRLSGGRFELGLGTQVKGHNERRYGIPWIEAPGPRMREYLLCLRAIFKKQRVAFYASTRTYHSVFEVHGWSELGTRLHALSLENKWAEMVKLIPDEMAEEFATVAPFDEIGPKVKERWGGILDTINFPTDFPMHTPEDERQVRQIVEMLHQP